MPRTEPEQISINDEQIEPLIAFLGDVAGAGEILITQQGDGTIFVAASLSSATILLDGGYDRD